jgi:hypothetical protein
VSGTAWQLRAVGVADGGACACPGAAPGWTVRPGGRCHAVRLDTHFVSGGVDVLEHNYTVLYRQGTGWA